MKSKVFSILSAAALLTSSASAISVDVELALLIDVSSSIDNTEWDIQKNGYEAAFRDAGLQDLIANSPNGVAVSYIEFATNQATRVSWTHLTDAASSNAFADSIAALTRLNSGIGPLTEIAGAITFASDSISGNAFEGVRKIIDVSGDGKDNREPVSGGFFKVLEKDDAAGFIVTGEKTAAAAQAAIDAGVNQVNGLPVVTADVDDPGLEAWYIQYVKAGTGSFVTAANSFDDFEPTILEKLKTEIKEPEPEGVPDSGATAALLGFGLLALGAINRRVKR